jgi:uncharacterized phiE125 gp8 family phage protein
MQSNIISGNTSFQFVSSASTKSYLRLDSDFTADDELINELIYAVQRFIESYCEISLSEKLLEVRYQKNQIYRIPYRPVQNIVEVATWLNGVKTVLDTTQYEITGGEKGKTLKLKYPYLFSELVIVYSVGYTSTAQIPSNLRIAGLRLIADLYQNRENSVEIEKIKVSFDSIKLLNQEKYVAWF